MDCCCPEENITQFKIDVNQILGRLFSQYYNITCISFLDEDGLVVDYHIHSLNNQKTETFKKLEEISKAAVEFKIASIKASKLLGFSTSSETFFKGDSHICVTYDIDNYFLLIIIEMSKPLVDSFDFEKFNEKIELIIIELKKKIESTKKDESNDN